MLLADLFDLTNVVSADPKKRHRVKHHPARPWKPQEVRRMGDTGGRTPEEVHSILAAAAVGEIGEWMPYQPPVAPEVEPSRPRLALNQHDD